MNEQNKTETTWWERNKKKVLIIGGVVVAVGVSVLIFKAAPHKDCAEDAPTDFSSDCIEISQAYLRMSRDFYAR